MGTLKYSIDLLRDYDAQKAAIISMTERLAAINSSMYSVKAVATDSEPVHGGGNKQEERLAALMDEKSELRRRIAYVKSCVRSVERGLSSLSEDERLVLRRFYVSRPRNHVEILCEELNVEKATVYRIAEKALVKFALSQYGEASR